MANKTLIQKIARVFLAGSLAGLSGCTTAAVLGDMAQVSPYTTSGEKMLGRGLSTYGRMEHDKEVAEIGKTEINVDVRSNETRKKRPRKITNLNTNETVLYSGNLFDYFDDVTENEGFPSKGFKVRLRSRDTFWIWILEGDHYVIKDENGDFIRDDMGNKRTIPTHFPRK